MHIDKLKLFLVDAPSAWTFDDLPDADGESRTESPTPPVFTQSSTLGGPEGTDIKYGYDGGNVPIGSAVPPRPLPGVKEAWSGVHAKIPRWKGVSQFGCVAHPPTYATVIATQ